jgi:hypothetical protein
MVGQPGDPGRAAFAAGDPDAAADAEVMCLLPNWTGVDQMRYYYMQEARLSLKTPPMTIGGVEQVSSLVWERLP